MENATDPPPYHCPYCGCPSWIHPQDADPPVDYCHDGDHGSAEDMLDE